MADARVVDLFRRCDPIFAFHRVEPMDHGPDRSRAFDTSLLCARPAPPREHTIVFARSPFAAWYEVSPVSWGIRAQIEVLEPPAHLLACHRLFAAPLLRGGSPRCRACHYPFYSDIGSDAPLPASGAFQSVSKTSLIPGSS